MTTKDIQDIAVGDHIVSITFTDAAVDPNVEWWRFVVNIGPELIIGSDNYDTNTIRIIVSGNIYYIAEQGVWRDSIVAGATGNTFAWFKDSKRIEFQTKGTVISRIPDLPDIGTYDDGGSGPGPIPPGDKKFWLITQIVENSWMNLRFESKVVSKDNHVYNTFKAKNKDERWCYLPDSTPIVDEDIAWNGWQIIRYPLEEEQCLAGLRDGILMIKYIQIGTAPTTSSVIVHIAANALEDIGWYYPYRDMKNFQSSLYDDSGTVIEDWSDLVQLDGTSATTDPIYSGFTFYDNLTLNNNYIIKIKDDNSSTPVIKEYPFTAIEPGVVLTPNFYGTG